MRRTRVGVVGVGFAGAVHIEALRRLGVVDIVAIAEKDKRTAENAARKHYVPKAYGDWEELVADNEVETVHITCTNVLHYPIAKACIAAGKNVVCEKPLTLNTAEAKELVILARKGRVVNATTFNYGCYPLVVEAREMIKRGELGRPHFFFGRYCQDWLSSDTDYNWRVEARYQGKSRVISDLGSHLLYLAQAVLGKRILSVFGEKSILIPERSKPKSELPTFSQGRSGPDEYQRITVDTEDQATILLDFEDGIKGVIYLSQVCPGRKNRLEWEINGSRKSVSWQQEEPNQLWVGNRDRSNETLLKEPSILSEKSSKRVSYPGGLAEGYGDSWKNILSSIYEHIRKDESKAVEEVDGTPDYPTFEDGYRNMAIVDAILESTIENRRVSIDWSQLDAGIAQ